MPVDIGINLNSVNEKLSDLLNGQSFETTLTEHTVNGTHGYTVTLETGGQTVSEFFPGFVLSWSPLNVDQLVAYALFDNLG